MAVAAWAAAWVAWAVWTSKWLILAINLDCENQEWPFMAALLGKSRCNTKNPASAGFFFGLARSWLPVVASAVAAARMKSARGLDAPLAWI
jgi:hypothetical protein